jgi:phosphohistidine phosphatase SixA
VTILLVRHAKAGQRGKYDGPDEERPLSKKGWRQAEGLVEALKGYGVSRILSSPYVRCVQTVEPLADALGLTVEPADELVEGADPAETRELMRRLGNEGAVAALCTHGDMVPGVLDLLVAHEGLELPPDYPFQKGSTWVITEEDGRLEARYLPPPGD